MDSINFLKEKGISIKGPLRFIGGGTLSTLWLNILSDILGQGGIMPVYGGITLDLKRMNRLVEINEKSQTVTAR